MNQKLSYNLNNVLVSYGVFLPQIQPYGRIPKIISAHSLLALVLGNIVQCQKSLSELLCVVER